MNKETLGAILHGMAPIELEEMGKARLQRRTDTKYIFGRRHLPLVVQALAADHRVLHVDGRIGSNYRTLYFDTPDLRAYLDHHNGRTFRSKVRIREYVDSGLFFLEVKQRTGRGGTSKARLRVASMVRTLNAEQLDFVGRHTTLGPSLHPMLCNEFHRYTFIHMHENERITLDTGLSFGSGDDLVRIDGICVAELKQERAAHRSPFAVLMRTLRARPLSFSKYCIGMVLSRPELKYNRFKPTLLQAAKAGASVHTTPKR